MVVMKRRLQAVCLGTELEEIIILFPSRVVLALGDENAAYSRDSTCPIRRFQRFHLVWAHEASLAAERFPGCSAASPLARRFVYPKLTLNQETRQLLFALCSAYLLVLSRHLSPDSQESVMHMCTQKTETSFASKPETNKHAARPFFYALTFFFVGGIINFQPS